MCYIKNRQIIIILQILCLCSQLYGVKVYHGTTQEDSEEDQSEEDIGDEDNPEYDDDTDIDYTKFFHKSPNSQQGGQRFVEPLDLSQFFQDVDDGKYNRAERFRSDPSESESVNFPDFFDMVDISNQVAASSNNFAEIVEKETDHHLGPSMTQDFDRLVDDIHYDINMQDFRRGSVLSKRSTDKLAAIDENINSTNTKNSKHKLKMNKKSHQSLKEEIPEGKNATKTESILSKSVNFNENQVEKSSLEDHFEIPAKFNREYSRTICNDQQDDCTVIDKTFMDSNETNSTPNNVKNVSKKKYIDENNPDIKLQKLNDEMKEKIRISNTDLVKKLNASNIEIERKINALKKEQDTIMNINQPLFNNLLNVTGKSEDNFSMGITNNMSMNMFGGDSKHISRVLPLSLKNNEQSDVDEEALKEFSQKIRESTQKRYASDAYFPEPNDYYSDYSQSQSTPVYDDYDNSKQEPQDQPKPKSYNKPLDTQMNYPFNPENIPPSSSFAHMYRTFDNDEPISTHYSTNHDPNHSLYESTGPYSSADPKSYEPNSNYKYDSALFDYDSNYKKPKKPSKMVEVEGDSPDLEYQRMTEPNDEDTNLDETDFDIDKFISDFNTDPPYAINDEENSDEERGEEEEEEEREDEETDEGERETRPREYKYEKKTTYGSKPERINFEKPFQQTRPSSLRTRKTFIETTEEIPTRHSSTAEGKRRLSPREQKREKETVFPKEYVSKDVSNEKPKPIKKCTRTTKTLPDGNKKMNCKICENIKTGGKSEHCSFLINPNKDNYFVGTEEVTYRTKKRSNSREKRETRKNYNQKFLDRIDKIVNKREITLPKYDIFVKSYPFLDDNFSREKRQSYDDDEEEEDDEDDDALEAEYGPKYDPYFGEPEGYKSSDGGSCRTVYEEDGSECRVCTNRKTNGEFKECSYTSKPLKNSYAYGSSKVYGSGKNPRFRRQKSNRFKRKSSESIENSMIKNNKGDENNFRKTNHSDNGNDNILKQGVTKKDLYKSSVLTLDQVAKLGKTLLADIPTSEDRGNEEVSQENMKKLRKHDNSNNERKQQKKTEAQDLLSDFKLESNEGGEYMGDKNPKNESTNHEKRELLEDGQPAESRFNNERESYYNNQFSRSFPELLDEKESLELPAFKKNSNLFNDDSSDGLFSNRNSYLDKTFKSGSLLKDDGYKSPGLLNDRDFFKRKKINIGSRFENSKSNVEDLFNDKDSDNINRMFGEFASKDRSNCKKRFKDKMTCYACVDENNIRQEECIYIKNSEPETKQVEYKETNQYNNPNPKPQSSIDKEIKYYPSSRSENYNNYEYDDIPRDIEEIDKSSESSRYFNNERPSSIEHNNFEIKRKHPKNRISEGNYEKAEEEIDDIMQNLDIQKVNRGRLKNKNHEKKKEQISSGSSVMENIEVPDLKENQLPRHKMNFEADKYERSNKVNLINNTLAITNQNQTDASIAEDNQGEGSHTYDNIDDIQKKSHDDDDEPVEPEIEGPEGAFSEETEPIYDPERGFELRRYMVEKSEGETIFDQISGLKL